MSDPVDVYLDTQDYSKFADVGTSKEQADAKEVLPWLLEQKLKGHIRIIYSAMNLSELLQYAGGGVDLTLRKARVVEKLAGTNAFFHSGRLLAHQIARFSVETEENINDFPILPISSSNGWFPSVDLLEELGNFGKIKQQLISEQLKNIQSRSMRRKFLSQTRNFGFDDIPKSSFHEMSLNYPFSLDLLEQLARAFFRPGRSDSNAVEMLLCEMGQPERFVHWYFENSNGERSFPAWLRGGGEIIAKLIEDLRLSISHHPNEIEARRIVSALLEKFGMIFAQKLINRSSKLGLEFGISEDRMKQISTDKYLIHKIPYLRLVMSLLPDYVREHTILDHTRNPSGSDGGDILHALVLPYCDVWRGDRYFSALLKRHVGPKDARVVGKLGELPDAILDVMKAKN